MVRRRALFRAVAMLITVVVMVVMVMVMVMVFVFAALVLGLVLRLVLYLCPFRQVERRTFILAVVTMVVSHSVDLLSPQDIRPCPRRSQESRGHKAGAAAHSI